MDDEDTLTIDQAKYFAFQVDDIEAKQSHVNWMDLAVSSAAYTIKDSFDAAILDYMETQADSGNFFGSRSSPTDVGYDAGETSPLNVLARLSRLLDDQNVPSDNRWLVARPVFWEVMANENSKLIDASVTGDGASPLRNGLVTNNLIHGFRLYKSNNVPNSSSTSSTWSGGVTDVVIAGHMSAVATASQIAKTEILRRETSFADLARGMHMYGRKALRPTALASAYYKVD